MGELFPADFNTARSAIWTVMPTLPELFPGTPSGMLLAVTVAVFVIVVPPVPAFTATTTRSVSESPLFIAPTVHRPVPLTYVPCDVVWD